MEAGVLGASSLDSAGLSLVHLYFYLSVSVFSDRKRKSCVKSLVQFPITSPKPWREFCCWEGAWLSPGLPAALHRAREAAPILQPVEPFTQSPSVNSICNIN